MSSSPPPRSWLRRGVECARTAKIFGIEPKVAFLSYSTKGSGKGPAVDLAREACAKAKEMAPEFDIDGEMQFDAAVSPTVGQLKFPGSKVAGYANTFIFPEIQSGNIGYKIAQRLGGFDAYGPHPAGPERPHQRPLPRLQCGRGVSDVDHYGGAQIIITRGTGGPPRRLPSIKNVWLFGACGPQRAIHFARRTAARLRLKGAR